MKALADVSLSIPAVVALGREEMRSSEQNITFLSDGLAIVLIVIYALYILFSLRQGSPETGACEHHDAPTMKLSVVLGLMAATTIGIVFMSEPLVFGISSYPVG